MISRLSTIFFLAMGIISCTDDGSEPCNWNQSAFYAKVEKVEFDRLNANKDSVFTVWVNFSTGSLSDELQDLGKLRGIEFTREKLIANSAKVGLSYTGTISDATSGSCESPMVSFEQKAR